MVETATRTTSESLEWVRAELTSTFIDARTQLQKFSDNPEDRTPVGELADLLHSAHGALRMVEVYGAALLVEEMVTVARKLAAAELTSIGESLEVLSRAIVQLPAYLDRVASGGNDVPLVLLPLLNDLRAVRGSPLLSESSLFVLNVDQGAATPQRPSPPLAIEYHVLAQKLRPHYQKALLGWLRGEQVDGNLRRLLEVAGKLEANAKSTSVYQFWWIMCGAIEAVLDGGLRPGAAVKRLLGQADQSLKLLSTDGEKIFEREAPTNLINSLLYYIARADCDGAYVSAIKSSFSLSEVVGPGETDLQSGHTQLHAPSVDLMKTVGAAIKQDLAYVKDAIDIFVRTKSDKYEDLKEQCPSLKKLADTLGVLGLDQLRQQVASEHDRLQAYIDGGTGDEDQLLIVAASLINVEAALDEQLLEIVIPSATPEQKSTLSASELAAVADLRNVTEAVMRECVVNLTRIKESLSQFVENSASASTLDSISPLMVAITAGLTMLEKSRAADLLSNIDEFIDVITSQKNASKYKNELDRLADAIVSIEYYMETVGAGRSDPWYMLDNADRCLQSIENQLPERPKAPVEVVPDLAQLQQTKASATSEQSANESATPTTAASESDAQDKVGTSEAQAAETAPVVDHSAVDNVEFVRVTGGDPTQEATPGAMTEAQQTASGVLQAVRHGSGRELDTISGNRIDPELLELFIEEAKEEVVALRRAIPRWKQTLENREVMLNIRRSFHTLKGSGRMVGAMMIGEYSWSFENLINKVVSQFIRPTPAVVRTMEDAVEGLPTLIEQIEVGGAPTESLKLLMDKAWILADNEGVFSDDDAATTGHDIEPDSEEQVPEELSLGATERKITTDDSEVAVETAQLDDRLAADEDNLLADSLSTAEDNALIADSSDEHGADRSLDAVTDDAEHIQTQTGMDYSVDGESTRSSPVLDDSVVEASDFVAASLVGSAANDTQPSVDSGVLADAGRVSASANVVSESPESKSPELEKPEPDSPESESFESELAELEAADFEAEKVTGQLSSSDSTSTTGMVPGIVMQMEPPAFNQTGVIPGLEEVDAEPAIRLDPALHQIFLKESLEHLAVISEYISDVEKQVEPFAVTESLHRAWHTLSGSANTANVPEAAKIATPVNQHLRTCLAEGRPLTEASIQVLRSASAGFEWIVRSINARPSLPDHEHLLAEIATLPQLSIDAVDQAEAADGTGEVLTQPMAQVGPGYDLEIAAIFADEANEILESSDAALAGWFRDNANGTVRMEELLRHLHTLKGGARMAGIAAVGDLSHETESLIERVRDQQQHLTPECRSVVQLSYDRLHDMVDSIAHSRPVGSADDLIAQIHTIDQAGKTPPVAAKPAEPVPQADSPVEVSQTDEVTAPVNQQVDETEPAEPASVSDASSASVNTDSVSIPSHAIEEAAALVQATASEAPVAAPAPVAQQAPTTKATETDDKPTDIARIEARLLDEMLNNAGEVSIFHSRLEDQVGSISFNLTELNQTVLRLREQLRKLEIETEAQILHKHHDQSSRDDEFDPLELDRYSGMQQLSRALAESVSDLVSLQDLMTDITRESESLLVQQARVTGELQDALIRSRMLPFSRYVPRFERIVRQAASEQGKQAHLKVSGAAGELDRQVLQRMLPPFEHMLRNAVIHGIESAAERQAASKDGSGEISIDLVREGAEMVIRCSDDGRGINPQAVREKAQSLGLIRADQSIDDHSVLDFVFHHGFSTAGSITQASGRGVGMDVVANDVKMLGGSVQLESIPGTGTTFTIRLPLTLAVSQALLVRCGDERFAIPLPAVDGVIRAPTEKVTLCLKHGSDYVHEGKSYTVRKLAPFVGAAPLQAESLEGATVSLILIRAGEHSSAFVVDELLGSREVVVKSAGPMVSSIQGVAGATILGDGSIVVILDVASLLRNRTDLQDKKEFVVAESTEDLRPVVLVVDDSITVRRVTQRLLERNSMKVLLAKDGVDAVAVMQEQVPDLVLLDIEMPRMDGYEVASHIRNTVELQHLPITMITSRVGDKHRARAFELGVDKYLGKPYQENQLLDVIQPLLERALKQRK